MSIVFATIAALLIFGYFAISDIRRIRKLSLQKRHDKILYYFCRSRDRIALAALEGKCREDGKIFEFFYTTNASIIHYHQRSGICFRDLVRFTVERISHIEDPEERLLMSELDSADASVKTAVSEWNSAFRYAVISSAHLIVLDRLRHVLRIKSERMLMLALRLLTRDAKDSSDFVYRLNLRCS